jgi:hypothetical protein
MNNVIIYTVFIIIIMIGLVLPSTAVHAFSIVDLSTTDDNLTELQQQEQQQMILPIPIPTHSDAERIMMAIKMALNLEPGSNMQQYSLLRIQEILENNFTSADGYTVHVNYTDDTRTEAETEEEEDTRMLEKTLSIQISNQKSGGSNITKE